MRQEGHTRRLRLVWDIGHSWLVKASIRGSIVSLFNRELSVLVIRELETVILFFNFDGVRNFDLAVAVAVALAIVLCRRSYYRSCRRFHYQISL